MTLYKIDENITSCGAKKRNKSGKELEKVPLSLSSHQVIYKKKINK